MHTKVAGFVTERVAWRHLPVPFATLSGHFVIQAIFILFTVICKIFHWQKKDELILQNFRHCFIIKASRLH